ncbi:MAG TPA: hypothetical protein VNQ76_07410 [Planctomicrobium sp.]|nr:hypothetical protein [Planctomicrobium sp.]
MTVESGVHVVDLSTEILKHTSRSLGVKVQDLLFASLLEALSLNFSSELAKSRRKNIGIYAPADLRAESVVNTDATIGQILGCITVREQVGPGMSFSELVRNVASQTSSVKKRKAHRDHSFHMNVMSRIWDLFPDRLNRVAGPYLIPLSGYISNVNLTDFLAEELVNGTIRNYFRYSGTGLLSPMMLGITTLGPVFNLTTTHHRDVFTHEDITRIVSHVQMRLAGHVELSGCRKEVPARSSARKPVGVI